ncbi:MAG: thiamine pyrophosphate-requiring protein [Rhizobiales bacterium]|nr:thiamine pyrophosphate-requiring protein [Hyphomicrobiales bacterium]
MKVNQAIAEILKREGIEILFCYPRNELIEGAAAADIRTIFTRQERTAVHMADAMSRMTRGKKLGVFCMQQGPGSENAYGGIAQAFSESVPVLVIPRGFNRRLAHVPRNFNSTIVMAHVAKHAEPLTAAAEVEHVFRRAFTQLRNGRGAPVVVEVPGDVFAEEVPGPITYTPVVVTRYAPEASAVAAAAKTLLAAERLVIYAGQGVHWAEAYDELRELAELFAAPVCTSLPGKSSFDETHPLSLGSGGVTMRKSLWDCLHAADVIFGIGCSFSATPFGVAIPHGKTVVHATLDPADLNKNVPVAHGLIGDAKLTLQALIAECRKDLKTARDPGPVVARIKEIETAWMAQWLPKLTSDEVPLSPYRVIADLWRTVDLNRTVITHDSGSPRDQLTPFWRATRPHSYIGWGKSTQLGYGFGLILGAKLACPDKLCVNVWGDAAIGFTGMDFETAVRARIPILSILLNNSAMAVELDSLPVSTQKYRATDISGDYAAFARAMGGYGERIERPDEIVPAIHRGIAATEAGTPALLEFITSQETAKSMFG